MVDGLLFMGLLFIGSRVLVLCQRHPCGVGTRCFTSQTADFRLVYRLWLKELLLIAILIFILILISAQRIGLLVYWFMDYEETAIAFGNRIVYEVRGMGCQEDMGIGGSVFGNRYSVSKVSR